MGYSGYSGKSGYSGFSGVTSPSGFSGYSGNASSGYSGYSGANSGIISGSFSQGGNVLQTTFVITIGVTMSNNTYKVLINASNALSAIICYVGTKTTTTFTVTFTVGITGTCIFDWAVIP